VSECLTCYTSKLPSVGPGLPGFHRFARLEPHHKSKAMWRNFLAIASDATRKLNSTKKNIPNLFTLFVQ